MQCDYNVTLHITVLLFVLHGGILKDMTICIHETLIGEHLVVSYANEHREANFRSTFDQYSVDSVLYVADRSWQVSVDCQK